MRTAPLAGIVMLLGACAAEDARRAFVVNTIVQVDAALIRTRPRLAYAKFRALAADDFDFFRGTYPLFLRSAEEGGAPVSFTRFRADDLGLVFSIGDAHPENFGLLEGDDGALVLEPNDFDAADYRPWHWEVRRAAAGLEIIARRAVPAAADAVADAFVRAYVDAMIAAAGGEPIAAVGEADAEAYGPLIADLFARGTRDRARRRELETLTETRGDERRLKRGVLDALEPWQTATALPDYARVRVGEALTAWRANRPDRPALRVVDAVRVYGVGVASRARLRLYVLAAPPAGPEVVLELKELVDSGVREYLPPGLRFDSVQARVDAARDAFLTRGAASEPFWGTGVWMGFPLQVRREAESQKGVRRERVTADAAGTAGLIGAARAIGRTLARMHAAAPNRRTARSIAAVLAADAPGFAAETRAAVLRIANDNARDRRLFVAALAEYGSRLGVPVDAADAPEADLAALFGDGPDVYPPIEPSAPAAGETPP